MTRLEKALVSILGFYPSYLRPPFASCDWSCQADMAELGYHVLNFDVDTKDYENNSPTAIRTSMDKFALAISGDPNSSSYIVLSHDVYAQTTDTLLVFMLEMIEKEGFQAVTVGECLGDPVENWYRTP
jgi:peptidoglycan/xylan/chitin deacetylase (PgdA/CDA1 family)